MSAVIVRRPVTSVRGLALSGLRAHGASMAGTGLVVALAAALVSMIGVLAESGLRADGTDGGMLVAVASSFAGTALIVVVIVVSATSTLALRRRRRELALLRAVGGTRRQVRQLISTEMLTLSAVAASVGAVPGLFAASLLEPTLRAAGVVGDDFAVRLSPLPALSAIVLLVPTVLMASRLAARESVRLDPTAAIRTSQAETTPVGSVRRTAAAVSAALGVVIAFTPLVIPGTAGSALAASSAFCLIGSAALAGPLLVGWAFARTARLGHRRGPVVRLALGNLRGFSRRLTTVVVPMVLILAVATTQTTVDRVIGTAASEQLAAAIGTELVATSPDGLTDEQLAAIADAPGVSAVAPIGAVPGQVRTDDELPASLAWEATQIRVVPPAVAPGVFDPSVNRGDLAALADVDTVAISSDAAFDTAAGLGDHVDLRLDGSAVSARVVAIYDRGLGVGDYLVGPSTASAHGLDSGPSTALIATSSPDTGEVGAAASRSAGPGALIVTTGEFVDRSTSPDAAAQRLSSILTLVLLVFVSVGAVNSLVLITTGRRHELRLLHRGGATRRQLVAMLMVESVITGVLAWLVGTVVVVPGVMGMNLGLLGPGIPLIDVPSYLAASVAVIVLTVGSTAVASRRTVRAATTLAP